MSINQIKTLLLQAEKALILCQFFQAKKILQLAMKMDDENTEVYYLLGEVYCKTNKFEQAREVFQAVQGFKKLRSWVKNRNN